MISNVNIFQEQAYQYLIQSNYNKATTLYEQAIADEPNIKSHYWHLGLALLLQGQETEAQMTWMLPLTEVEPEDIELYTNELIQVLQTEAERREIKEEYSTAWVIRQHIREINPEDINNLLELIQLSIKQESLEDTTLNDWAIIELLKQDNNLDLGLLQQVLQEFLENVPFHPSTLEFVEACLTNFSNPEDCFWIILPAAMKIGHTLKNPELAAHILELYLCIDAENIEALKHLSIFNQNYGNYSEGIEKARLCYSLSRTIPDKIAAIHVVLRGLMTAGGYWQEINATCKELEALLQEFIQAQPYPLDGVRTLYLLTPSFAIPHIKDTPKEFRAIHNRIAQIFQSNIQAAAKEKGILNAQNTWQLEIAATQTKSTSVDFIKPAQAGFASVAPQFHCEGNSPQPLTTSTKKLKIGYLSYALRRHSVGWLARWLFQHHDREKFEINTYFVNYKLVDDWLQEWYVNESTNAHKLGMDGLEIAEKINEDEIDILIDLDSITLDISSEVLALKPAPVQATWLGWDASGIPAVDYFIADPYVLPDSAQDYYSEKIWRLPQTYIAVDGFEVGTPTLRRDDLDIPSDAVIYLSAQRGYKRHPETIKWQMKIIKDVPNSYFLIKGDAEEESIKRFFNQIAEEEGVDCSRLRFLPQVASEATHRANLAIADVVLDTYPYNGATTTLEILWMCVPLVTRVGEQFAARNSYTMMMNAGITEGIAWTDEEYIEWGIRLGKDAKLRQEISWKLRQSRQTAPLWNGKQFTREMEKAYEQMWANHISAR
ncbi:O-linked N-acetylglucosamine transferase, SPINDLY family protein [Rivularia sp. UHCC 0363]|uniref:O-linked N-acetylglucosamine transferase, SPINDLY family protein n=1 Tax=Rivularia sp. UHCC 0363 TaxID=3110244 RepID=UPI002B1F3E03|nr:O-linked N-acetylglucosamine transferase, SPINDLY family protein [Rivularia sp. UHCC 0363]MEA5595365.1 O-linked N-acetylglucosamine transferase, SPINDLY family protein [Rivularia sp. UHCC 0363]